MTPRIGDVVSDWESAADRLLRLALCRERCLTVPRHVEHAFQIVVVDDFADEAKLDFAAFEHEIHGVLSNRAHQGRSPMRADRYVPVNESPFCLSVTVGVPVPFSVTTENAHLPVRS